MYPVVHRPTILKAYEQYLNNTESLKHDIHVMAQLNLIFGIAALSSNVGPNTSTHVVKRHTHHSVVEDQPRPRFL